MAGQKTFRPRLSSRETWAFFCAPVPPNAWLRLLLTVLVGSSFVGCQNTAPRELSLARQADQVRSGISETIVVEEVSLGDDDLDALRDLSGLRTLLLDHPDSQFSSAGLSQLSGLTNLTHLRLRGRGFDDEALRQLAHLQSLKILNVPHATISDAGLAHLADLPNLEQLRLGSPHVSPAGIESIAGLPALKRLHLIDIPVGNAGLQALAGMQQLESLYLDGADVSDAAVDELFRARPKLHVHFNQEHHDRDPSRHSHSP